jgi:hypothetical protein
MPTEDAVPAFLMKAQFVSDLKAGSAPFAFCAKDELWRTAP